LTVDRGFDDDDPLSVRGTDGRALSASLAGRDPSTGLALLRVDGLGATPLSATPGLPRVGSLIVSIGRGMSGGLIAGSGLVSSVGGPLRTGRGPAIEQVIRTDVTPYPGFSGGPVIDPIGHVVGVATGAQLRGLGLVIPASIAWQVAETLSTHGRIRRGYLGISSQPVRIPERQRAGRPGDHGLLVVGVGPDSPAARAGLLVGDIVVEFDGQPVADAEQLLALLAGDRAGTNVQAGVIRAGGYQNVQVLVAER
jgi:S1-C subfamily serine protease